MGRTHLTGCRHLDAPDAEYRQESAYLDSSDTHIRYHWAARHVPFRHADERRCSVIRYGYLRFCRSDRCLLGLGKRRRRRNERSHHCDGLDRAFRYMHRSSGSAHTAVPHAGKEARLGKRRGLKVAGVILNKQ